MLVALCSDPKQCDELEPGRAAGGSPLLHSSCCGGGCRRGVLARRVRDISLQVEVGEWAGFLPFAALLVTLGSQQQVC